MMRTKAFRLAGAAALVLALGACEGVKSQLGLVKSSPDEFRVVSRAPLSLPPEFNLRPPEPGLARPQEGSPTNQARRAVFRADGPNTALLSEATPGDQRSVGERSLLKAAGADSADPNIRVVVNSETQQINNEADSFVDTLVFWRNAPIPGEIVDAEAESKRLRENTALGKSVTEGETPSIERKSKGIFEGIF